MTETIEFLGATFAITEKVGALPLMRFAKIAKTGVDSNEMDGLAAMYDLLEQCIAPDDWGRFEAHADRERADGEELMKVVQQVFAAIAERPTGRSSDSSGGPRTIEPNSTVVSSSPATSDPVISRFNDKGRPDLALLVRRRQESLAS